MSLGISVNEQDLFALVRQCSSKIDTRRRLSAAALSVADSNCSTQKTLPADTDSTFHANPRESELSRRAPAGLS